MSCCRDARRVELREPGARASTGTSPRVSPAHGPGGRPRARAGGARLTVGDESVAAAPRRGGPCCQWPTPTEPNGQIHPHRADAALMESLGFGRLKDGWTGSPSRRVHPATRLPDARRIEISEEPKPTDSLRFRRPRTERVGDGRVGRESKLVHSRGTAVTNFGDLERLSHSTRDDDVNGHARVSAPPATLCCRESQEPGCTCAIAQILKSPVVIAIPADRCSAGDRKAALAGALPNRSGCAFSSISPMAASAPSATFPMRRVSGAEQSRHIAILRTAHVTSRRDGRTTGTAAPIAAS